MGEVYRARDSRLGRDVALKLLLGELADDPIRRQRFELEARAVATLSYPTIVALFDIGPRQRRFLTSSANSSVASPCAERNSACAKPSTSPRLDLNTQNTVQNKFMAVF
jgi:serine/threonine protein kinase